MPEFNMTKYLQAAERPHYKHLGKVMKIVGLTIESVGPEAKLNDLCRIILDPEKGKELMAEVVGFRDKRILLMPLDSTEGLGVGCVVENTGHPLNVPVGDGMLGHTLDGIGRPTDGADFSHLTVEYPTEAAPPDPMDRVIIKDVLSLGVKVVDGLLTVGKGQRIGIFAGSGVGKSTIMGMFARNTKADINVIALIGERGREVREFVENDMGVEGMRRSVVVIATSDKPALIRRQAAKTATAIAEYFRDQGKDVLLMMDSLTRFSMAQREIGLASGEPPVTRGYPPSIYAEMPKLLERAGNGKTGSITGLYTVLVDGDDMNEPIADTARSILDGHIVLNRRIAHRNHYPAVDVMASISRCMSAIASGDHKKAAGQMRNVMATYAEAEDLINIGAYKRGSNPNVDNAIDKIDAVNQFLQQPTHQPWSFEETMKKLYEIFPQGMEPEIADLPPDYMLPDEKAKIEEQKEIEEYQRRMAEKKLTEAG
ncbi:MAG: flagellar protein export ATPase FliI [Lachnospiraceae bacterium]|nr:flagellar protein export ATPase FliI [Lachnospiraceae bacterium]